MKKYSIIFGGGKFGLQAVQVLRKDGHVVIIDENIEKIAQIHPNFLIFDLEQTKSWLSKNTNALADQYDVILLSGSIVECYNLFFIQSPDYLIPSAPVHVMALFLKQYYYSTFPNLTIKFEKVIENYPEKPFELNIISSEGTDTYFSYATWEERCPDTCLGPKDFCFYHKRNKPITVTDFLKNHFQSIIHVNFESIQIGNGVGGISSENILSNLKILEENDSKKIKNSAIKVYVSTTCFCHGVLSLLTSNK